MKMEAAGFNIMLVHGVISQKSNVNVLVINAFNLSLVFGITESSVHIEGIGADFMVM
jgi:hypothetical protein